MAAAAVHDDADSRDLPAVGTDNVNGFLDAAAARDNVLRNDEPLVRCDLEAATENEPALVLLHENVALTQGSADFLSDHDPAKSGGDDRVAFKMPKLVRQPPADVCRDVGILEEKRALKKLPAMQAGSQNEVAIEQSPCSAEEREQILAHYPEVSLAVLPPEDPPSSKAIASISTRAFFGNVETPTVERAGGFWLK